MGCDETQIQHHSKVFCNVLKPNMELPHVDERPLDGVMFHCRVSLLEDSPKFFFSPTIG